MSEIRFEFKKTTELSIDEINRIVEMHESVFGQSSTAEKFYLRYTSTQLGYSYHFLMCDDGVIEGHHSLIPQTFIVNGERRVFVYGSNTMIMKGHRDISNYLDLLAFSSKCIKELGVSVNYGYPNDLNYKIMTKAKKAKTVGHMYTYFLPYRIGGLKKKLWFFNWVSQLFCYVWFFVSSIFASSKVASFKFSKELESFNSVRYNAPEKNYCVKDGFVYRIMDYEGVRTAFLIDVFEKSPRNFCKAVKYLLKHESKNFDVILYPGYLPFAITGMIKIPHKYEPKHFHMTAGIVNGEGIDEAEILDIKNWDTNLSNYDLI